ncbi:Xylene monooxygenase electron transfer component [compost metagenome]
MYGTGVTEEEAEVELQPVTTVTLQWQGKTLPGNNQQVLLEQLEQAGIRVPYSCRAGICGSCRITLVDGEVTALKKSAISDDGTILCCSCIPKTSLQLEL